MKITRRKSLQLLAAATVPGACLTKAIGQTAAASASTAAAAPAVKLPPAPIRPPAGFGVAAGPFKPNWES
jgi:hypothetical protein